jgi:putative tryptophan/tyrosine transport system substrate-binding protein
VTRREFITLLGGAAAAWPLAARAQQSKVVRLGALYIGTADAESFKKELREGLRELGYVEGQNIAFEFRSAEGKLDRLPELAAELVRLKVDVMVALYVPPSLAAKQATREIPIVVIVGDPVETGIVASLAHPGGNITGVSLMASVLHGKRSNCSAICCRRCIVWAYWGTPQILCSRKPCWTKFYSLVDRPARKSSQS